MNHSIINNIAFLSLCLLYYLFWSKLETFCNRNVNIKKKTTLIVLKGLRGLLLHLPCVTGVEVEVKLGEIGLLPSPQPPPVVLVRPWPLDARRPRDTTHPARLYQKRGARRSKLCAGDLCLTVLLSSTRTVF